MCVREKQLVYDLIGPYERSVYVAALSRVHFIVVDLDVQRSPEQQELDRECYKG
jgi:hypothetical protein